MATISSAGERKQNMAHPPDSTEDWKKRSVVSSFILKNYDGRPLVALFQRSETVSTYQ
jgi:hypothetical protein